MITIVGFKTALSPSVVPHQTLKFKPAKLVFCKNLKSQKTQAWLTAWTILKLQLQFGDFVHIQLLTQSVSNIRFTFAHIVHKSRQMMAQRFAPIFGRAENNHRTAITHCFNAQLSNGILIFRKFLSLPIVQSTNHLQIVAIDNVANLHHFPQFNRSKIGAEKLGIQPFR